MCKLNRNIKILKSLNKFNKGTKNVSKHTQNTRSKNVLGSDIKAKSYGKKYCRTRPDKESCPMNIEDLDLYFDAWNIVNVIHRMSYCL